MKPSPLMAVWNPRGGGSPHPGPESGGEERSQGLEVQIREHRRRQLKLGISGNASHQLA